MSTMPGDVLLSGAFLGYIGFFDHYYRSMLVRHWRAYLESVGITFRPELFLSEFLCKPSQRMEWQSHSLPSDDLCTENAIILSRFHRYPLIIDPSGQALEFILSFYNDKKITKSSFSDDAFLKSLETALRFGCPLLVQDVEKIDPILNSVLNNEIHRTGGRVLIRVGDQEIDFSPTFSMFMITRDSNAKFTPDLCSRVTFVNFTVTPSSLKEQCLNIYLRNERADVEEKRLSLLKLQGEYLVKLRELEDSLLNAISQAQGNILENDPLLHSLETLKSEASKITEEMAKSDKVMHEVQEVTSSYEPLSAASSKIYFSLIAMKSIHYLYDYSLSFFMETLFTMLSKSTDLAAIPKDKPDQRLVVLFNEVFVRMYRRVSLSLLTEDKMIVMMCLMKIKLGNEFAEFITPLIRSSTILEIEDNGILDGRLSSYQLKILEDLKSNLRFKGLLFHIRSNESAWLNLLSSSNLEGMIPSGWEDESFECGIFPGDERKREIASLLKDLTIIKALRPDRLESWALKLLGKVMGNTFLDEQQINMQQVIDIDSNNKTPVLMCSGPGNDPSQKVDSLARTLNKKYSAVAIGSAEGFIAAEKALQNSAKAGHWLLLKNVHLAPSWLNELEKKIHRLSSLHENFRLFLTMEFNPKVPETLIRQSYKLIFEAPDGIKASMQRTYHSVISSKSAEKPPNERARLHFLMSWLHSVVLERLRYIPIGWSKWYEFNEADQKCALDLIDEYMDSLGERNNVAPEKIPWEAIRCMLIQNLYGGKIDNEYDQRILTALVHQYFNPQCFSPDYPLFHSTEVVPIPVPEAIKNSQYMEWVERLPETDSPAWSGLPLTVEKILKERKAERTLSKLWELQDTADEEVTLDSFSSTKAAPSQVQWLRVLGERTGKYLELLPNSLGRLPRTAASLNNPLFRFLERETTVANALLELVRKNLADVKGMCEGKINSTNVLKTMAKTLYSENIPSGWCKFPIVKMNVNDWMLDLKKRLDQFAKLMKEKEYQKRGVWFGGLLFPEAFLTATRQMVAQENKWSLDELQLSVTLDDGSPVPDDCFLITEMTMEGGQLIGQGTVNSSNKISNPLSTLRFKWNKVLRKDEVPANTIKTPVYLNSERKNLIFSIYLGMEGLSETVLYQKGLAMVAWTND